MAKGFIYVLLCADSRLYIGSTRDLSRRIDAHKNGKVKTTKSRRPVALIYKEEMLNYKDARKRELYLKSGTGRDWLKKNMEGWLSGRKRRS
ncbi:MAG: GIY-YIG nuclease family protein [Candidatus Mariimomonas ferrooxydans]